MLRTWKVTDLARFSRLDPAGGKLDRRAIQLGIRGDILRAYGTSEIREILDLTQLAAEQRPYAKSRGEWHRLRTPVETVYKPIDPTVAQNIGLDAG